MRVRPNRRGRHLDAHARKRVIALADAIEANCMALCEGDRVRALVLGINSYRGHVARFPINAAAFDRAVLAVLRFRLNTECAARFDDAKVGA